DALARAVQWWRQQPDAVYITGSVRLVDGKGAVTQVFQAPRFDLLRHLRCEVVLAFAGLLNARTIGSDLYYDETMATCPDYAFWIRLGCRFDHRAFVAAPDVFKTARADRASMSYRAEVFPQFCSDKQFALNRFLDGQPAGAVVEEVRRTSSAGILLWAAEQVLALEGRSPLFARLRDQAAALDPWSPRLLKLVADAADRPVLHRRRARCPHRSGSGPDDSTPRPAAERRGCHAQRRPRWRSAEAAAGVR